jgi:hypothetical protein
MPVTATPIFPQAPKVWMASVGNSDATNWRRLLDPAFAGAGANGSKITALNFRSSDSVAKNIQVAIARSAAVTVTSASPGVVTWTGNTLAIGDQVFFDADTVPTGLTAYLPYFVVSANFVAGSTFSVATTAGGTAVNTSSTGTNVVCYQVRILATINVAIAAGNNASTAAAYLFNATLFPGFPVDNDGNPYLLLESSDYLCISDAATAVSANTIIDAIAFGGNF